MAAIANTSYNLNPTPTSGTSAFGSVPGQLGLPDPSADLGAQFPNLAGANTAASSDILSQLGGQLSPSTTSAIENAAATYGVANGMLGANAIPGTEPFNLGVATLGQTSEQLQNTGLANYNSTIPTISGTQTVSPTLQTEIATQNAVDAAAPDPTQAASYAESLFNKYLESMQGPAGGYSPALPSPAGGTGKPAATTTFAPAPGQGNPNTYLNGYGGTSGFSQSPDYQPAPIVGTNTATATTPGSIPNSVYQNWLQSQTPTGGQGFDPESGLPTSSSGFDWASLGGGGGDSGE